jgi:hypothetical protein
MVRANRKTVAGVMSQLGTSPNSSTPLRVFGQFRYLRDQLRGAHNREGGAGCRIDPACYRASRRDDLNHRHLKLTPRFDSLGTLCVTDLSDFDL